MFMIMCILNSDVHKIQLAPDIPDLRKRGSVCISLVKYTFIVMKNFTVILLSFDAYLPAPTSPPCAL